MTISMTAPPFRKRRSAYCLLTLGCIIAAWLLPMLFHMWAGYDEFGIILTFTIFLMVGLPLAVVAGLSAFIYPLDFTFQRRHRLLIVGGGLALFLAMFFLTDTDGFGYEWVSRNVIGQPLTETQKQVYNVIFCVGSGLSLVSWIVFVGLGIKARLASRTRTTVR